MAGPPDDSCKGCCDCPAPLIRWDSRSASKTKCGFAEFGTPSNPPKYYLKKRITTTVIRDQGGYPRIYYVTANGFYRYQEWQAYRIELTGYRETTYNPDTCAPTSTTTCTPESETVLETRYGNFTCAGTETTPTDDYYTEFCSAEVNDSAYPVVSTTVKELNSTVTTPLTDSGYLSISEACAGGYPGDDQLIPLEQTRNRKSELLDEYANDLLATQVAALLAAAGWDNDWNDTPGSFRDLSTSELTLSMRQSRYELPVPRVRVRSGKCYTALWDERFIPKAGVPISSLEVWKRGVYRPGVTVAAPPEGGEQAEVVAVMSPSGAVSAYKILHPGKGYTEAPEITVEAAAGEGGITATATGEIDAEGRLVTVTPGVGGNYLPTATLAAPGGTGGTTATVSLTLDPKGGIATAALTAAGSGYTATPAITITPRAGVGGGVILLHLGTEVARCGQWDGILPEAYDPLDIDTYPRIKNGGTPYWELAVPTENGTTLVANLRAVCRCNACP